MTPLTTSLLMLLLLVLAFGGRATAGDTCARRQWFSAVLDACVPCTPCSAPDRSIVLRPCQPHQDTVCGTLNDLQFEWNLLQTQQQPPQQPPQHRHRPAGGNGASAAAVAASSGQLLGSTWDWQPSSMAFAAVACVLFVVALVYILYQHAKQWRHMENMERRFDRGAYRSLTRRAVFTQCVSVLLCAGESRERPDVIVYVCAGAWFWHGISYGTQY